MSQVTKKALNKGLRRRIAVLCGLRNLHSLGGWLLRAARLLLHRLRALLQRSFKRALHTRRKPLCSQYGITKDSFYSVLCRYAVLAILAVHGDHPRKPLQASLGAAPPLSAKRCIRNKKS